MKITAAGDRALLVDLGEVTAAELHATAAEMRSRPGVVACIPGHSSLYLIFDRAIPNNGGQALLPVQDWLSSPLQTGQAGVPVLHRVAVHFDGPDLPEFLGRIALSFDDFLARVRQLRLVARYLGFRGGFAYLDGWPAEWAMPRRPTSRPVRRGTFAIAGSVAGFYPIDTPGGWNLLGHTLMSLENAIRAGDDLLIEPVGAPTDNPQPTTVTPPPSLPSIDILAAPLAIIVDRVDYSRLERGLAAGGPFDIEAAQHANRAVGNDPDAPVLECALVGPRIRAREDVVVAWESGTLRLHGGEELAFGRITSAFRAYLAVGKEKHEIEPLRRGDHLTIHTMAGPHHSGLREVVCTVTPRLDRVGIRLQPNEPLPLIAPGDLRSCGMQCGTVQLHPDGSLVVMGPDHPVTGGYLQPMTVLSGERWKVAQLAPGERVRLVVHWP